MEIIELIEAENENVYVTVKIKNKTYCGKLVFISEEIKTK